MDRQLPEVVKELKELISQIKGVKKISEELNMTYICTVEDEESKQNVEKVAKILAEQALKYGFVLDVFPVTEEDVALAKAKIAELKTESKTFK